MSMKQVEQFLDAVKDDEALQAELSKAMESEDDRQAVTDLANSKNYQFSSDELWAEVQKRQNAAKARQAAGELTDEELEAVAGGEFVFGASVITGVVVTAAIAWGAANNPNTKW